MPRKKTTPKKNSRKSKNKLGIGVYVFSALVLSVIIFWLSQPESGFKMLSYKKKAVEKVDPTIAGQKQIIADRLKRMNTGQEKEPDTATEKGIFSALEKLHINLPDIKHKQKENSVTITVPIDPAQSDLTFANMIIKGEVENQKGEFVSGIQKGRSQIITFRDNGSKQNFIVELYYKRNEETVQTNSRALTIIIDDFGSYKGNLLMGFAKTDPAVCFAIMPETDYADDVMQIATQYGHESIIHIPMEPINYPRENPGDHAIFIQLSENEINRRMERFIHQLPDCIGINNHMGSLATTDETAMQSVMQVLRKNNLIFVDSRTTSNSVAFKTAQKNQVTAFKRDIFLDVPDLSDANLDKKITECINLSQTKSYVIAIMHCHSDNHLAYLKRFISKAKQNGFELVPLSQLGAYKLPEIR